MRLRTTITISVAYNITLPEGMNDLAVCEAQERQIALDPGGTIDHFRAMASGPGGTITWTVKPEKESQL